MGKERDLYFKGLPKNLTSEPTTRVKIGDRYVGEGEPVFIVAEVSANHRKDFATALRMIDIAKDSGADAVKFQHYKGEAIAADTEILDTWHGKPIGPFSKYYDRSSMPYEWTEDLVKHAKKRGIMFLSSPFDEEAVDLLDSFDVPAFKIASFEMTSDSFLRYIARKGKPVILSTGMSYLEEVAHAVRVIQEEGNDQIIVLHCVSMYPPKSFADLNLRAIPALREALKLPIGYSDHSEPPWSAAGVVAVTLGACLIEKHFTDDQKGGSLDDVFSIQEKDFKHMIEEIRLAEAALSGSGIKQPVSYEGHDKDEVWDRFARRSLYAKVDIKKGTVLTEGMLAELRPFGGIAPQHQQLILGRKVIRDIKARQALTWDDLMEK